MNVGKRKQLRMATQCHAFDGFDGAGYGHIWPELASPGVSDRAQGIPIEVGNRVWSYMLLGLHMFTMVLGTQLVCFRMFHGKIGEMWPKPFQDLKIGWEK